MYSIRDNGTTPFFVSLNENLVKVYENPLNKVVSPPLKKNVLSTKDENRLGTPVKTFDSKFIFIGHISPKYYYSDSLFPFLDGILGRKKKIGFHSLNYMRKYAGNTILLKINRRDYVFIERCIYQFTVSDDYIVEYISPIGKNEVPYPVAYGKRYIYLLYEGRSSSRVLKDKIPKPYWKKENVGELIKFMYDNDDILSDWKSDIEDWKTLVKGSLYLQMND
jgi:hypothetical protein